jgi:hypothetical protein
VVVLGNCFLALHGGFLHRWYPRPHVSRIGVTTPSCIAKREIDYFHLVLRTWCMSTPTQESLIKMCHLQTKPQQNGTSKLLYPRTLIQRDLRTFLMITTMFPTLTHQTCPSTMRIPKGDQKNRTGCNNKLRESEKMDETSKTRLHTM